MMNRRSFLKAAAFGPSVITTGIHMRVRAAAGPTSTASASGSIHNVSKNVMRDVDPCNDPKGCIYWVGTGRGIDGTFDWGGGTYIPGGLLAITGGGHDSHYANWVAIYNMALRVWEETNQPYPAHRGSDFDEWGAWDGRRDAGPAATHSYDHQEGLSKELGGGKRGSLLLLTGAAGGAMAKPFDASWRYDVDTKKWTIYAGHLATGRNPYPQTPCAFDSVRNLFVQTTHTGRYIHTLDPRSPMDVKTPHGMAHRWVTQEARNFANWHWYKIGEFVPDHRCLLMLHQRDAAGAELWGIKLDGKTPLEWVNLGQVPDGLQWGAPAMIWNPKKKAVAFYRGLGLRHVNWCKLADKWGQPPTWSIETFGGDEPAWKLGSNGVDSLYNRFPYVPERGCHMFWDGSRSPVQEWHPSAV